MNSKQFALEVVTQLQQSGYQALWAGGCVRDSLMGRQPKDYDVATEATPDQVRTVFGKKRTLAIGASFGVITVLGPKTAEPIEVATFRRDGGYSDGRRPDHVEFTNAKEDALRRDFTINGMFFDPIEERVIDFVGGQEDIAAKRIRAIGTPAKRIEEDKLRMLRAIRFASTLDFTIEPNTMDAIRDNANQIQVVSGERIGAEMRRMFAHPNRACAAELLLDSKLLFSIVDDADALTEDRSQWLERMDSLQRLTLGDFSAAAKIFLEPMLQLKGVAGIFERWKLSNEERAAIEWMLRHESTLLHARDLPWSQVQRLLLNKHIELALASLEAKQQGIDSVEFCRKKLSEPKDRLDPPLLLTGADLIEIGVTPGPSFKKILDRCRNLQLDGQIESREQAMGIAEQMLRRS